MPQLPSTSSVYAAEAMVCTVDQLASTAGLRALEAGGSAVDAAIAANAVLTITQQHMCGLGGDLWAIVHPGGHGEVALLNASGRAGSGADPERLRAAGHTSMPHRGDVGAAPVPGAIDGWCALHERFGRLPMREVLAGAIDLAEAGFAATPHLAGAARRVAAVPGNTDFVGIAAGDRVRRPGAARTLRAIAEHGRDGYYGGEFGEGLIALGNGEYTADDLAAPQADWVSPLAADVWGHRVHTAPPNSQGYLSLAGALIAQGLELPTDTDDPLFAHLLIESARAAAFDRPDVLHEHADGQALIAADRMVQRRARISNDTTADWGDTHGDGGTIFLCTADSDGMAVSLIQSNARDFGSHLCVGDTGIFLHNRGIGFNLIDDHLAEYRPGRRPPHTLAPALVTNADGTLRSVLGTMGGDAQPQIVLQMLARLLHAGERPGTILSAPRFALASPDPTSGFETWSAGGAVRVELEPHATPWIDGLITRGHTLDIHPGGDLSGFGHAHMIDVTASGLVGASDPRARASAALGR